MKVTIKKIEAPKYENVEIREARVIDHINAERISGTDKGDKFFCALIAQVAMFDGNKLLMEDIMEFPANYFLDLANELLAQKQEHLGNLALSSSQGMDSAMKE